MADIVVAIIASVGGLLGSVLGVLASAKLTNYRIEQLEIKVNKHNNIIERTYKLETELELAKNEIEHLEDTTEKLESFHI